MGTSFYLLIRIKILMTNEETDYWLNKFFSTLKVESLSYT